MEIRKIAVGAAMIGALSVGGLGLAGTASAGTDCRYNCPKPASQTTKTSTVNVDRSQLGNGNVRQNAGMGAGGISNPQVGLGTNLGVQVPVNVNGGVSNQRPVHANADQAAKQRQAATGNVSNNSTSVNAALDNGRNAKAHINIGNN